MIEDFNRFLGLPERDRIDLFDQTAERIDNNPINVEKDFWVCLILDLLYNQIPDGHPRLLFKGGTSLSKVFGLIQRFSEDIDVVVCPDDLGFENERDPTKAEGLSKKKRNALFENLQAECSKYVLGDLCEVLRQLGEFECEVEADENDASRQTLLIAYPTLYPGEQLSYILPKVKIEAGARSALDPTAVGAVTPYVADELGDWSLQVDGITTICAERTYLEKLLILHGRYCGYRDGERIPDDRQRISRHYYDVAMIAGTETGEAASADLELLTSVREHNLRAFRQAWKCFEEAVPGSIRLVPQTPLKRAIENDYRQMQGMVFGDAPTFDWVMQQLEAAEERINRR